MGMFNFAQKTSTHHLPRMIISHPSPTVSPFSSENQSALTQWFNEQFNQGITTQYADHILVQIHQAFDWTPLEQACANYHDATQQRAPILHTVSRLIRAVVVKYLYGWSYRQTEEQIRHHLLVRWFVGYTPFAPTLDHSTLHLFALWLENHHPRLFFDEVLRQIDTAFPLQHRRDQVGDTFALRANAAWESLPALLRHTTAKLLRVCQQETPDHLDDLLATVQTEQIFGPEKEKPEFCLTSSQFQERAVGIVQALQPFLSYLQHHQPWPSQVTLWLGYLHKIIADEFTLERDATGHLQPVQVKPLKEKGAYRLISATDPEATLRVHGDQKDKGYNIQVATDGEFVTSIHAHTGSSPDSNGIETLIADQKAHRGSVPPKLIYDKAAGSGKKLHDVHQASDGATQLVTQRVDTHSRTNRFTAEQFSLTEEGGLTCPNGHTSYISYRSGHAQGWNYRFAADVCTGCPLAQACRGQAVKPSAPRQVFISDYLFLHRQALAYQQTPAFQADLKLRPVVERVIANLVQHGDARYAHGHGLAKADFQVKMCGMAFNLKTWMHKLEASRNAHLPLVAATKPKRQSLVRQVKSWLLSLPAHAEPTVGPPA